MLYSDRKDSSMKLLKYWFPAFLWLAGTIGLVLPVPAAVAVSNWRALGPVNIQSTEPSMGRVNCVAISPTNSQMLFACSASGGLWSSADSGGGWQPRTDQLPVLGTSGLVIDPQHPNIMYLATGDADAMDTPSVGVWKSTDGGVTWNPTGLNWSASSSLNIYKLVIHPTDPNRLFAATTDGIYSSTDAGTSWQRQTPDSQIIWYDVAFQPGNPSVMYAVTLQARFYRSSDTGATWQQFATGLPVGSSVERSALAVSPANPAGVYLLVVSAPTSYFFGLYRWTNGGPSFSQRASPATPVLGSSFGNQGFFDAVVAVSPADFNQVYVGGVNLAR